MVIFVIYLLAKQIFHLRDFEPPIHLPVEAIDFTPPHVLWKQQENASTPLLKQEIPQILKENVTQFSKDYKDPGFQCALHKILKPFAELSVKKVTNKLANLYLLESQDLRSEQLIYWLELLKGQSQRRNVDLLKVKLKNSQTQTFGFITGLEE
jgi:hypothetical protein